MILYKLGCIADHRFDSWFRDSAAFDEQVARGFLSCPICGSDKVAKAIMAPAVVGTAGKEIVAVSAPDSTTSGEPLLDARHLAVRAALRAIRTKMLTEGDDVGAQFPTEARLMHDGATPMRPIHGQATPEEARSLIEDGIPILPVPAAPEELN